MHQQGMEPSLWWPSSDWSWANVEERKEAELSLSDASSTLCVDPQSVSVIILPRTTAPGALLMGAQGLQHGRVQPARLH